jgi:hypothetical protein
MLGICRSPLPGDAALQRSALASRSGALVGAWQSQGGDGV